MIEIRPVPGIGEIRSGDALPVLIAEALEPIGVMPGDVVVVTQKIVSKAEGRMVDLATVTPGARALEIAATIGRDPRLVELALAESSAIVKIGRGVMITRHHLGLVMANAGIDCSNVGEQSGEQALLLPADPDASARRIADAIEEQRGIRPGVVISDSFGRPWRHGVTNVAIGSDGVPALHDMRGQTDRDGRTLQATLIAYGDLIASAAGLAMGEAAEGIPVVLIRGLSLPDAPRSALDLIRAPEEDMFR